MDMPRVVEKKSHGKCEQTEFVEFRTVLSAYIAIQKQLAFGKSIYN